MSNKTYDILARIQRLVLPILSAVFTFIVVMADTWHFNLPAEQIAATLTALDALLGTILAVLSNKYYKALNGEALEWEGIEAELNHDDAWEGEG